MSKYQKTLTGEQCITRCYKPLTKIIHPITSSIVGNRSFPFCAIIPIKRNGKTMPIGQCTLNNNDNEDNSERQDNLDELYPLINFDAKDFLLTYYDIDSVESFYDFLKNNRLHQILTKLRVIDCFIITYGKDVSMINNIFSETILNIIKSFWIKRMYGKLSKYVMCNDDEKCVFIDPSNNKNKKGDYIQQRIKYMYSDILTEENITYISNNYFNDISKNNKIYTFFNEGINDYYKYLLDNTITLIIKKIEK
jgi:hypothetical protein